MKSVVGFCEPLLQVGPNTLLQAVFQRQECVFLVKELVWEDEVFVIIDHAYMVPCIQKVLHK